MSKTITKSKHGSCDFCGKYNTPTLLFDDENRGYEGWHVTFELCLDCFTELLSVLEDDKEYNIADVYEMISENK